MIFPRLPKTDPHGLLAILLGVLVFLLITGGGKILWPTYIDWLYEGDSTTHWLGWQYFRYTPFAQWPIGANPDYGMEIGSSVVFTDSVSLMSILFKPFSAFLPDAFQYSGLWILICIVLQSYFAWKLLSIFTQDKWLPIIGSVFFAIAPPMLWRLQYHYALFAHWVLLDALYLYFVKRYSTIGWIALLGATALIEPYLLAMTIAIWFADVLQRRYLKQANNLDTLRYFVTASLSTLLAMWAAGYFMLGESVGASGFGYLRTNLLSLIDPDNMWSRVLRDQKGGGGDYEGFAYLGLGMLLLGLVAGYEFSRNAKLSYKPAIIPLLIVCTILFGFALSNHVGFGESEILSYDVPSVFKKITTSFRTSGRFFWPVYYVIYLVIFYLLFTRLKNRAAIILCVAMLVVQVVDTVDAWRFFRAKFANAPTWVSPMVSPAWSDMAHHYKKIIWVNLPRNSKVRWFPLCEFAATHRMAINIGYFGRSDPRKIEESAAKLEDTIVNNKLDSNALYVFEDDELWSRASKQASSLDVVGMLDGFRIVAPKLRNCKDCNQEAIDKITSGK